MNPLFESLVKAAEALGIDATRLRWKLMRFEQSLKASRHGAEARVAQVTYEHRICQDCGALNDRAARRCTRCERRLGARSLEVLGRLGLVLPDVLSPTVLLTTLCLIAYVRVALAAAEGGGGFLSFDGRLLGYFGGNWPPLVFAGQWWRLSTAVLLHGGLLHLAFNLVALSQIGPPLEELFGRGRTLLFFMLTGIVASLGSAFIGRLAVSIGASGAILGLVGVAAGWGQRDGTTRGRAVRDGMLRWAAYVVVFGFFLGADNAAHVVGFLAGGAIGLVIRPAGAARGGGADLAAGIIGGLLALGSLVRILFPAG